MTHNETCRHCGLTADHPAQLCENGVHYARVRCVSCSRFLRFLPKPDSDPTKYKRPAEHRDLVGKFSEGFCEMCLRSQDDLPKRQTLVAHHVREYRNGGSSKRENIWVICTACHQMIHWVRTYHGSLQGAVKLRNEATDMELFSMEETNAPF